MGEMAIRACTAHSIIMYLKQGMSLEQAGSMAMEDLKDLGGDYISVMNIVAMDKDGNHAAFSSQEGRSYVYIEEGMTEAIEKERTLIDIPPRWKHS